MNPEILIAIIAFLGAFLAGIFALIGSIIGTFISLKLSKQSRQDKYLFAALDKKLEKHQEAYALASDFARIAHEQNTDARIKKINDLQKWWKENCLYIEPIARQALFDAINTTTIYKEILSAHKSGSISTKELLDKWDTITTAHLKIARGINQPLLVAPELKYDAKGLKKDNNTREG